MTLKIKDQLEWLLMCICNQYQIKVEDIYTKKRLRENVMCRQIFYYLAYDLFPKRFSLKVLSNNFFHQDHTTIIYSIKNINGFLEYDVVLQDEMKEIKENFNLFDKK